jgi:hypothetical protein
MGTVTARWWLFEALTAIVIGIKNSSEDYLLGFCWAFRFSAHYLFVGGTKVM